MLELNSNPAVTAKVRAMYGRRISDEQYDELMKRRSVSEIAGYLKSNTHFSAALANINESNIHRGQLEDVLRREVFNSYSRLYRYTNVRGENLFHYVIMEEEIGEILRMVQPVSYTHLHLVEIDKQAQKHFERLIEGTKQTQAI